MQLNLFYIVVFSLALVWSCNPDDEMDDTPAIMEVMLSDFQKDSLGICETNIGSLPVDIPDINLAVKINSIVKTTSGVGTSIVKDTFIYETNTERLAEIHKRGDATQVLKFHYSNSKLIAISYFDSIPMMGELPKNVDSLTYNNNDNLIKYATYKITVTTAYELVRYSDYFYAEGILDYSINYYQNTNSEINISNYYRYCWQNENMVSARSYSNDGMVSIETNYEYDNHLSYKKMDPSSFIFQANWSKNNITKIAWIEHLLAIEPLCGHPCLFNLEYNSDGYPVKIESENGFEKNEILYK